MEVPKTSQTLPFGAEGFGFDHFEKFVRGLLNLATDIEIAGIGPLDEWELIPRYGSNGDKQRGIDARGKLVAGGEVVFQCKYHGGGQRSGKPEVTKAVNMANQQYPDAERYVFVTNTSLTPAAQDVINDEKNWSQLGGEELHDLVRRLPERRGAYLVYDAFGRGVAEQFFPFFNARLLGPREYMESYEGVFQHHHACRGREKEVKELVALLGSEKPTVVVVKGRGGIGKTRLMLEVLEQIEEAGDFAPFVYKSSGFGSKNLPDYHGRRGFVVGIDDGHASSNLDVDLLEEIRSSGKGRALIMIRPEGEEAVREKLRKIWGSRIYFYPQVGSDGRSELSELNKDAMGEIVSGIVGKSNFDVRALVKACSGNMLFAVIGAQIIRDGIAGWPDLFLTDKFKNEVLMHLHSKFVASVDESRKKEADRLLRTLSILSPFNEETLKLVSEFLDLSKWNLRDYLDGLLDLGLLRRVGGISKIVPDLFAEHLAAETLLSEEGDQFRNEFLDSPLNRWNDFAVLKNLAIAEEARQNQGLGNVQFFEKHWVVFKREFEMADTRGRSEMLAQWGDFGVRIPRYTLKLADLAYSLPPKEDQENGDFLIDHQNFYEEELKSKSNSLLVDLAKYETEVIENCLDLLWVNNDKTVEAVTPLFGYYRSRKVDSFERSLKWLKGRVDAEFSIHLESMSEGLEKVLEGAFAATIEDSYMSGSMAYFREVPVHFENTSTIREVAFEMVEEVLNLGDLGILNVIGLLVKVAGPPSRPGRNEHTAEFIESWGKVRERALELLEKAIHLSEGEEVRFQVRAGLKRLFKYRMDDPRFLEQIDEVLHGVEVTPEMERLVFLASNVYDEICRLDGDVDQLEDDRRRKREWEVFGKRIVNEFVSETQSAEPPIAKMERIDQQLRSVDHRPSWFEFFRILYENRPRWITGLRDEVLRRPECPFAGCYLQFCGLLSGGDPTRYDTLLSEGLRVERIDLLEAIIHDIAYSQEDQIPKESYARLKELFQTAEGEVLTFLLNLPHHYEHTPMEVFLNENLPWANMRANDFKALGARYDRFHPPSLEVFPDGFWRSFFGRLATLPGEVISKCWYLAHVATREDPDAAFDYYERRMEAGEDEVFPFEYDGVLVLGSSEKIENYEARVDKAYQGFVGNSGDYRWKRWLRLVLSADSAKAEEIAKRYLLTVGEKDLIDFADDWFDRSRVFEARELVRVTLLRAKGFSEKCYRETKSSIWRHAVMGGRSFTNGVQSDNWVLDLARDRREESRGDDVLFDFYSELVKYEEDYARKQKDDFQNEQLRAREYT